ncbi:MAG: hypothetical protein U0230_04550 [Polyangiales bacterium]
MTTESRSTLPARTTGLRATTLALALLLGGCGVRGVDPDTLPPDLRSSYALFEVRCSKCHTIARPLNAPIRDATHWELYVTRMRRVPGSGIDERDAREILRFLTYYTEVIRAGHGGGAETSGGAGATESEEEVSSEPEDASPVEAPTQATEPPAPSTESPIPLDEPGGADAPAE